MGDQQHVAVIGYGAMGHHHARTLHKLGHKVTTIDPNPVARAERQDTNPRDTDTFDLAIIATPAATLTTTAHPWLEHCDTLVEKPGATTSASLQRLADHAHRHGRNLTIGYVERHNPALTELRHHLRGQAIRTAHAQRLGPPARNTVSPTLDLLTHDIDALRYLGTSTTAHQLHTNGPDARATLDLDHGGAAVLDVSLNHPRKHRRLTIHTHQHEHRLDYIRQALSIDGQAIPIRCALPLTLELQTALEHQPTTPTDAIATLQTVEALHTMAAQPLATAA